ncbi:MAG: hypothetical protein LLF99_06670, partial [Desulfobacteraceae bacterium]|nr:hypothetical protein [Desulfobacteraceae bacterium]
LTDFAGFHDNTAVFVCHDESPMFPVSTTKQKEKGTLTVPLYLSTVGVPAIFRKVRLLQAADVFQRIFPNNRFIKDCQPFVRMNPFSGSESRG